MEHFINLFTGSWAIGLSLGPLLCVVGAAATAAGVHYYMWKRDRRSEDVEERAIPAQFSKALEEKVRKLEDLLLESYAECEKKTEECEREREAKSVLQSQYGQIKETSSDIEKTLMTSLAEAERRSKELEEAYYYLNAELTAERNTLKLSLLQKAAIAQECEQQQEAYSALKLQHEETLEQRDEFLKECEQQQEAYSALKLQHEETLEQRDEFLKMCEQVGEAFSVLKLEHEETLEQRDEFLKMYEQVGEAFSVLQSEYDQMKKTELRQNSSVEDNLADAEIRSELLKEANDHLQNYTVQLTEDNNTLQQSLQDLRNETVAIAQECEQQQEAYSALKLQYDQMKESLLDNEKSLKVTLDEAVRAHEQAMETNAQLENEKSDLVCHVHKLTCTVRELEQMLCDADVTCGVIKQERENAREAYTALMPKHKQTLKQRDEFLKECEQTREAFSFLRSQYDQMKETLLDTEKTLLVTLKESITMSKRYEMMEINAQMEKEQLDYVQNLRGTVEQLEEKIHEAERTCEEIKQERESAREAYSALKSQHEETLKQCDELIVSLTEAEKKYETAMEANGQLENEKSDLMSQVKALQNLVQQLEEELSEKSKDAHDILEMQYNEIKEHLQQCSELLNNHLLALGSEAPTVE